MIKFTYQAACPDGSISHGKIDASSRSEALDALQSQNVWVTDLKELTEGRRGRITLREGAIIFRGLANLLEVGVPLDRALMMTSVPEKLTPHIESIREAVRHGNTLAAALESANSFPPVAVGLIRAGEHSGLDQAVASAASQLEQDDEVASEIKAALAYPAILIAVGLTAVLVLVVGVLSRFVSLFEGLELPAATSALVSLSAFMRNSWPVVVGCLGVGAIVGARWLGSPTGHAGLLRIPLVGKLRMSFATARSTQALGAMLETGAPMLAAIAAATHAAGDLEVSRRLGRVADRVRVGHRLSESLAREKAMTLQAVQLVAAGEESGKLAGLLQHASALARSDARRGLQTAIKLIEPMLIVLFGAVVGFVALALLQAVYGMRAGLV